MLEPITYKLAVDEKGRLDGIELWQGGQHITVSMISHGTHQNGYRWNEVTKAVDQLSSAFDIRKLTGFGNPEARENVL